MPELNSSTLLFQNPDFEIKITTFHGLESVLSNELVKLGGRNVIEFKRGVSVTGDWGFVYKCNYCLRTAIKVLVPICEFTARQADELYTAVNAIAWEQLFSNEHSFAVESVLRSDYFNNSMFCNQRVKDAIVDRFRRETGKRPNVDRKEAEIRIYAHIHQDKWMLAIDTSGVPLYKRGYKTDSHQASMKEVLAAGLIQLSQWNAPAYLLDGMSGSGTLAIEAAMYALQIPAGMYRDRFAFESLKQFNPELWNRVKESALSRIKEIPLTIQANEIQKKTYESTLKTVKKADLADVIQCTNASFFELPPQKSQGVIILNPPYGERMPLSEITHFYRELGNTLKRWYSGYTAWIISSHTEALKSIGLKPSKKFTVFNGALECKFLGFELYEGSRKLKSKL